MDITAAPSREITELFVVGTRSFATRPQAIFDREEAERSSDAISLEVRGPVSPRHLRDTSIVSRLAPLSLKLADVARIEFGVELKFHLNLEDELQPVLVIDSGAEELLELVKVRKRHQVLGYARHIADSGLSWDYISDIIHSINGLNGRRY